MNVLILSKNYDVSTEEVMGWLHHYGMKSTRVNIEDLIHHDLDIDILTDKIHITKNGVVIDLLKFDVVWNRKWTDNTPLKSSNSIVFKNLVDEFLVIKNFIISEINNSTTLINGRLVGKLTQLNLAKKVGISIPKTVVINSKPLDLNLKHKITKPLSNPIILRDKDEAYTNYTTDSFDNTPSKFFPSLVQDKIIKKFEIRSFFLNGQFYSMAIFSQNNPQTAVDFRKYSTDKPNRMVPYKLPLDICKKLSQLMNLLKLDSGSIDLIKTESGDYVFLEVNTHGQFGMVSHPCNYYIEKAIAKEILKIYEK